MKLPNYLYLFTKLSLFIIIAFTFFVFWNIDKVLAINNCNDGWQIAVGQTKQINCHGICKKVTNNCSKTIFVPTRTSSEWSEFRINRPSCVSLSECCSVGEICNYGSWQCDGSCRRKRVLYKYDSNCNCVASGQYEYQNCPSGTTCSGGSCRNDVACSTSGYACKDQCTRGQRQYRCDGSNNCNQFWRWINTSSCNPFKCSGGSCSNVCESSCGADAACDGKSPGSSCGSGKQCNSNCDCISIITDRDCPDDCDSLWDLCNCPTDSPPAPCAPDACEYSRIGSAKIGELWVSAFSGGWFCSTKAVCKAGTNCYRCDYSKGGDLYCVKTTADGSILCWNHTTGKLEDCGVCLEQHD